MIDSLSVKNYKSIKDASLDGIPEFAAVAGKNAAGKSNLLQVIQIIHQLSEGQSINEMEGIFWFSPHEFFNISQPSQVAEFIIKFHNNGIKYVLEVTIEQRVKSDSTQKLIFSHEKLTACNKQSIPETVYSRDRNNVFNANNDKTQVKVDEEKLSLLNYDDPKAQEALQILSGMKFVNIIDTSVLYNPLAKLSGESLASMIVRIRRNPELFKQFIKIVNEVLHLSPKIFEIPSSQGVKQSLEKDQSFLFLFEIENISGNLSPYVQSSGDLKTLYILANAVDIDEGSILVIEEIENGMHPKRASELVERLETIARIRSLQILFSTHSPALLNVVSPQKMIQVTKKDIGTKFSLLGNHQQASKINKYLDDGGEMVDILDSDI